MVISVQTWETLYLCSNAHVKKKNSDWKLWHINAHINPITLFSIHVNTTFRFINRNEFSPIEPKIVHVNVTNEKRCFFVASWCSCNIYRIAEGYGDQGNCEKIDLLPLFSTPSPPNNGFILVCTPSKFPKDNIKSRFTQKYVQLRKSNELLIFLNLSWVLWSCIVNVRVVPPMLILEVCKRVT